MFIDKELKINQYAEDVADEVSDILSKENNRNIDPSLVYECVKDQVDDKSLIDDVYHKSINLLEDKYGILFDVDKNIEI